MEKHVTLVGILNIVYGAFGVVGAGCLFFMTFFVDYLFGYLLRTGELRPYEFPLELLDILPFLFVVIAVLLLLVSLPGIIGGIGLLKRKEWARIVVLIVGFLSLIRIPLGTILGIYTIWVLMHDDAIRLFRSQATPQQGPAA
jgi:hypothetical protein